MILNQILCDYLFLLVYGFYKKNGILSFQKECKCQAISYKTVSNNSV